MDSDSRQVQPDATWWKHSELLERRSVVGMLGIAAVVALFVVVAPWINDNVEQSGGLDAAGRFIVDDYTAIELADGWTIEDQSEFFTIATDGSYQMVLVVSSVDATAPSDALQAIHDTFEQDPANSVTPIVTFSTDAGGDAAGYRALIASDPTGNGSAFFTVSQAGRLFSPSVSGPSDLDDPLYDEVEAMVRSVVISAEPREAS